LGRSPHVLLAPIRTRRYRNHRPAGRRAMEFESPGQTGASCCYNAPMKQTAALLMLMVAVSVAAFAQKTSNPFLGRWDFNITTPAGNRGSWLGVVEKGGTVEVWYQPTGGNVLLMKEFKIDGAHLTLTVSAAL